MIEFSKIKEMLDLTMKQVGPETSEMISHEIEIGTAEVFMTTGERFFARDEDEIAPSYIAPVEVKGPIQGTIYLSFALADTIVLSGVFLKFTAARILQKRKLAIHEPEDDDAFREIVNLIVGSIKSNVGPQLGEKVKLNLGTLQQYPPSQKEENAVVEPPFPNGDYLLYRAPLSIPGYEMNTLDILIPFTLATTIEPQPEAEKKATEAADSPAPEPIPSEPESSSPEPKEEVEATPGPSILLLGQRGRQDIVDKLTANDIKVHWEPMGGGSIAFLQKSNVKITLVALDSSSDQSLLICDKVVPEMQKVGGMVVLLAPEWTRTSVLKAMKAGAKGVLAHPFDEGDLGRAISRCQPGLFPQLDQ